MRRVAALSFVAALLLASCQSSGGSDGLTLHDPVGSPSTSDALVIGVVGTLSGPDRWQGSDAFEGANLAVSVINRIPGTPPYELVTLDDRGDPKRGAELVRRIVDNPRSIGVVFAGPPSVPIETRRALENAGIPGLVCYSDLAGRRALKPPLFQLTAPDSWQALRVLDYAFDDRGYKRVGVLADSSSEGDVALAALKGEAAHHGHRVAVARIDQGTAPTAPLAYLEKRRVQAIVVAGTPQEGAATVSALSGMGAGYRGTKRSIADSGHWRPQLLGLQGLVSSQATQAGALPGTIATGVFNRNAPYIPLNQTRRYVDSFKKWWGHAPYGEQNLAYDAVTEIQRAVQRAGVKTDSETPDRSGVARALEALPTLNPSGVPLSFSRSDRIGPEPAALGLWTVPATSDSFAGSLPPKFQWVPLSRGFSARNKRTRLPSFTWPKLFKHAALNASRAPDLSALRYGVASNGSDPLH